MRLPARLGGTSPFGSHTDGYDRDAYRALSANYGDGAYHADRESGHGRYRYARAVGLSWVDVWDELVRTSACPPHAIHLLSEWEADLGLSERTEWTEELRLARIRGRCLEPPGNNPAVIKIAFESLVWQTVRVVEGMAGGLGSTDDTRVFACTAVVFEDPVAIYENTRLWSEVLALARRMEPAHGVITPCVTHDGAGIATRLPQFRCDDSLLDRDAIGEV